MTPTRHARSRRLFVLPALLALLTVATGGLSPSVAGAAGPPSTEPPGSYVLVDADSGTVLMALNEHQPLLTASTIKPFTAMVALEHLPMTATIRVSKLAAAQPAAKIDMKEGSDWPIQHALDSLMMVSANDAAYALAENAGGDLAGFAALATATGQRLGLRDTTFQDPAGLDGPEGFGGGTTSSAYDLAIITRNALTLPAIADPAARIREEFTDPSGVGRSLNNHNRGFLTSYPGAIGFKTGRTQAAGRTIITAARRDGRTLIAVVMGTWDDTGWASYLLDQGFAGVQPGADAAVMPPVRIASLAARAGVFGGLPLALGSALGGRSGSATAPTELGAAMPPAAPTTPGADAPTTAAAAPATAGANAKTLATDSAESGWTIGSMLQTAGFVLLGLLVVLFLLRRRAVKRQRARRIERMRAHAEARRRGMIDVVAADDSDIRLLPARTSHHVAATGKRHPSDRRVLRPARPRDRISAPRDGTR